MSLAAKERQLLRERIRGSVLFDEPMARRTTMQVGGPADAWIQPVDIDDVAAALRLAAELDLPWFPVGRGSNLLVRDGGLRALAINLANLEGLREEITTGTAAPQGVAAETGGTTAPQGVAAETGETTIYAEAGVRLKRLLGFCAERGFSGLEGLEGVPGTVGGAIIMNAGTAYGVIGDAVLDVTYLDRAGELITRRCGQLGFAYRKSKIPRRAIVLATRLRVRRVSPEGVRATMAELRFKREKVQPGTQPALGSVFRNPERRSAWSLIDEALLRGVRIGKARVSKLHANWIVNEGGASAHDVETLIKLVREQVKERCGVLLEPEVIIVGEERCT